MEISRRGLRYTKSLNVRTRHCSRAHALFLSTITNFNIHHPLSESEKTYIQQACNCSFTTRPSICQTLRLALTYFCLSAGLNLDSTQRASLGPHQGINTLPPRACRESTMIAYLVTLIEAIMLPLRGSIPRVRRW